MPTFSYLVTATPGTTATLVSELNHTNYCEAVAADNEELIILVTETPDQSAETRLHHQLKAMSQIQSVSMTFGHTEQPNQN